MAIEMNPAWMSSTGLTWGFFGPSQKAVMLRRAEHACKSVGARLPTQEDAWHTWGEYPPIDGFPCGAEKRDYVQGSIYWTSTPSTNFYDNDPKTTPLRIVYGCSHQTWSTTSPNLFYSEKYSAYWNTENQYACVFDKDDKI